MFSLILNKKYRPYGFQAEIPLSDLSLVIASKHCRKKLRKSADGITSSSRNIIQSCTP